MLKPPILCKKMQDKTLLLFVMLGIVFAFNQICLIDIIINIYIIEG